MMGEEYWLDLEQAMDEGKCDYRRTAYTLLGLAREMDAQLELEHERATGVNAP